MDLHVQMKYYTPIAYNNIFFILSEGRGIWKKFTSIQIFLIFLLCCCPLYSIHMSVWIESVNLQMNKLPYEEILNFLWTVCLHFNIGAK